MAKQVKEKSVKGSRLVSFFDKHTNKPVQLHIKKKHIQLNIQGEIHKHDNQYWITRGDAKTILEMKRTGNWLSHLLDWPDKHYTISVTIMVGGETLANLTVPIRSNEKLPCRLE